MHNIKKIIYFLILIFFVPIFIIYLFFCFTIPLFKLGKTKKGKDITFYVCKDLIHSDYVFESNLFEDVFGKKPIPTRGGGSIPIVALFERVLGLKSVLMGFGLDSDAIHSPNEHYGLFNFYTGIETIALFHKHFASKMK